MNKFNRDGGENTSTTLGGPLSPPPFCKHTIEGFLREDGLPEVSIPR